MDLLFPHTPVRNIPNVLDAHISNPSLRWLDGLIAFAANQLTPPAVKQQPQVFAVLIPLASATCGRLNIRELCVIPA